MTETEKFVIQRLDKIESKIDKLADKIDQRISPLEKFQYKLLGVMLLLSTGIPLLVACIQNH